MSITEQLAQRAATTNAKIVLPEGDDPRVVEAAKILVGMGGIRPILITTAQHDGIETRHPTTDKNFADVADAFYQLRQHKGITPEQANEQTNKALTYAIMLVRMGQADGCVAGAVHATSDVLRGGLQLLGMQDGMSVASSTFLMVLSDGRPITYGDCGMVPNPNAEQLANIAVASARTHEQLTGQTPIVAMLSFSTKGSAEHETVTKVREATAIAQQMAPNIAIDGELQFDAAFVPAIGKRKAPDSGVAGNANVFIFPNLDAGNIAYKITERIGGAQALGPLIQGLSKPLHDLSRGCKAEDIVVVSQIAAIQAGL